MMADDGVSKVGSFTGKPLVPGVTDLDKMLWNEAVEAAKRNHARQDGSSGVSTGQQDQRTTQYSLSVGGTFGMLIGGGGNFSVGISVPNDWTDIGDYQIFTSLQANGMMGPGGYVGGGVSVGKYSSDGRLPYASTGYGWYTEADAGAGSSVGVSAQGPIDMERKLPLPPSGGSFTPAPRVGWGFGLYAAGGMHGSVTFASPTPRQASHFLGEVWNELFGARPAY
jgi:hypothetical protein